MKRTVLCLTLLLLMEGALAAQFDSSRSEPRTVAATDTTRVRKRPHKSPRGAMLRSLALPGWGQLYNRQPIKAGLVIAAQGTLIGLRFYYNARAARFSDDPARRNLYLDRRNLMYWLMGGVALLSMVDAYIDAHLFNFDTGPDLALRLGPTPAAGAQSIPLGITFRATF